MIWTTGLILAALAFGQVPAELAKPVFIESTSTEAAVGSVGDSRIVSGWEAVPGQHPHQVSLRLVANGGGVSACGGSVVSRDWVISAAHCTAQRVTIVVRAGVTSLTLPEYIFETTEYYNHPTYDNNRPGVVQPNDIAMVKLQRPVRYTKLLQPIRVQPAAEAFRNYDGQVVYASGWGRLWTNGAQPEVLNWVYLRATSNQNCQLIYGTHLINEAAICAGWYNVTSQSVCQGDSGGPLVHLNNEGKPIIIGIASFVAGGDFGCHSWHPGGFVRPGPFHAWMTQVTGIDFDNLNEEDEVTEAPEIPTTEVTQPSTEVTVPPTQPSTTEPSTRPPTTPEPEEEDESEEEDSDSEEDPDISELLKKLIVKVKVKVKINNKVKRKVKVKCVDKF